ncbi:hypothetical protein GCM10023175_72500 [Pseudonocardia xishanensis]|uniref:Core-binding (CB) domain-containing protein n=1 Tax=Pseudonocardia xishanensis TaxID=630995 RepID=A0ABP8S555_9PSEU
MLHHAVERAQAAGCSPATIAGLVVGLFGQLTRPEGGDPERHNVRRSDLTKVLRVAATAKLAAAVLHEHGMLVDDSVPAIRVWIDRKSAQLPPGFAEPINEWLLELHVGGDRARPRSTSTIYAYFGRVQPHLLGWSQRYRHLREVTETDVRIALGGLAGHERAGVFTSLRSLFGFARRRRIVFTDPARRLHVGRAPKRSVLPMTAAEIAAVKHAAVTPAQRLVVGLVGVYAARATAIRLLTLDDVDLARRRIRINDSTQQLPDLPHRLLVEWLTHRRRLWPHTPNRHVLVSRATAGGTEPVSDHYLSWHLAMQHIPLERLRADRVLHEALAVTADPLHLASAFNLSTQTAIDYAEIARNLSERPIEHQALGP